MRLTLLLTVVALLGVSVPARAANEKPLLPPAVLAQQNDPATRDRRAEPPPVLLPQVGDDALPRTGSDPLPLLVGGMLLLGSGLVLASAVPRT